MNIVVKASVWYTICRFVQKGLMLFVTPIFTRLLSSEDYGNFTTFNAWSDILFVFTTLNISWGTFNNGLLKYENQQKEYTSVITVATSLLSGCIFFVFFLFQNPISMWMGLPVFVIYIMFLQFFLTAPIDYWMSKERFAYRYKSVVFVTLTMSILSPLIGMIAVISMDMNKYVGRILGHVIVIAVFGVFLYVSILRKGKRLWNKEYVFYTFKLAIPLIPHYLSQVVLNNSDRIMISRICAAAKAGIYSVAYSAGNLLVILNNSINASFIPWMYRELKAKKYHRIKSIVTVLCLGVGTANLILIICTPELVFLLAPVEYADAKWLIAPIACGAFMQFLASIFINVEMYFEKTKYISYFSIMAAVLNVVLNLFALEKWGYAAAAYTTLICYAFFAFVHYCCMRRICKGVGVKEAIISIKGIGSVAVLFVVLAGAQMLVFDMPLIRYMQIIVLLILLYVKREKIHALSEMLWKTE